MKAKCSFQFLGAMAIAAGCMAGHANASAIDVALANYATTTTTGNATNAGINPITYTPVQTTLPYVAGQTYDAADLTDTGTIWNSIQSVSTVPTSPSVGVTQVLYQQNLPLVDSLGKASNVTMNVSAIESNNKSDYIHLGHNDAAGNGTDGLPAGPATTLDGYGTDAGAAHMELMNTAWVANGASEGMAFAFSGLAPGSYNLYVYGTGVSMGQGATFTMATANGGASASTNSSNTTEYRSVFQADGVTPVAAGESWNELSFTVGNTGDASFTALASPGGLKPSIDGFQIDAAVPEPGALAWIAVGGLALRRRK